MRANRAPCPLGTLRITIIIDLNFYKNGTILLHRCIVCYFLMKKNEVQLTKRVPDSSPFLSPAGMVERTLFLDRRRHKVYPKLHHNNNLGQKPCCLKSNVQIEDNLCVLVEATIHCISSQKENNPLYADATSQHFQPSPFSYLL